MSVQVLEKLDDIKYKKSILNKEYRLKNIDRIKEKASEYYKQNRIKIKEKSNNYYYNNLQQIKQVNQKYRLKNKKIIQEKKTNYWNNKHWFMELTPFRLFWNNVEKNEKRKKNRNKWLKYNRNKRREYEKQYRELNHNKLKEYRLKNKENNRKIKRIYQKKNKERIRGKNKEWRMNNGSILKMKKKKYYIKTKNEILEKQKKKYHEDDLFRSRRKEQAILYQKNNPNTHLKATKKQLKKLSKYFNIKSELYGYAVLAWAKYVKRRDDYKCIFCGSDKNLHAHHILPKAKYPLLSLNINNGITLCQDHHKEIHRLNMRILN